MTALLKYDVAVAAVAAAATTDEVAEWESKAAAMHEYARRIRDRSVEINMAVLKSHCKRRRGEILREYRAAGLLREGKPPEETVLSPGQLAPVTLDDLDISRNESSECQKIAALEGDAYSRLVERCRAHLEANPKAHSIDVLRAPDQPINGARSIMGSRQEPDDSLDYFPTPPWATRALIERVFPDLKCRSECARQSAWEPACGEGHIAEVLREYFGQVIASDIHDYGYGGGDSDFLDENTDGDGDWIITNPPFGDKTEQFVLRALDQAKVGVAMFVRLQWLETIGRYERLFRDFPPTLISFFCERVNLCKGRWDPEGSTATAYIWLTWIKGRKPQAPFWIPPGCRESLTRPDDAARFTTHPVTRQEHPIDAAGLPLIHDDKTGEISDDVRSGNPVGSDDRRDSRCDSGCAPDVLGDLRPVQVGVLTEVEDIPAFLRRQPDNTVADVKPCA